MRGLPACAALGLSVLVSAQSAFAGIIVHYTDVGNVNTQGVAYTNISESNSKDDASGLYGQPILSADQGLLFNHPQNFSAISTGGNPTATNGFLSFDVHLLAAAPPTAILLSEQGTFSQLNGDNSSLPGGLGDIFGSISLYDIGGSVPFATAYLVVDPSNPQVTTGAGYFWTGTADFANNAGIPRTDFTVHYENDLLATSLVHSVTDLEKKNIAFDIAGVQAPNVPEPASLGLLALGGLGLLGRRASRR